jgi:hypothetical protein
MSDESNAEFEESSVIKDLRAKANKASDFERQATELAAKVADMERRDVFRSAGLDPSNRLHEVAMKGYDGELDQTAVQAYVTDLGLVAPPAQQVPQAEQEAFGRMQQVQAGGEMPPPLPSHDQEMTAFFNSLPNGMDKAQALSEWLGSRGEFTSNSGPQSSPAPW